jgi:hypothetical protein
VWRCSGKVVSEEALCTHHQVFTVHFKNVYSDWSYECIHNRVNVSIRGLMLSGQSDVTLAVTILCWLQLCTATRGSVVTLSGHFCTDTNLTQNFHSGIFFGSDSVVILLPWLRWWTYVLALHVYTGWATAGDNILGLFVRKPHINMGPTFNRYGAMGVFNSHKYTSVTLISHLMESVICYATLNGLCICHWIWISVWIWKLKGGRSMHFRLNSSTPTCSTQN